ncbi:MAG TPA: hypothetical protein VHB77_11075 [Planctomycetaceae bacterium]|nr:hypothetical protein [Planctomycetaceae bacterium]
MDRKRGWTAIAGMLVGSLLLLGAYAGAYFALVKPARVMVMRTWPSAEVFVIPRYPRSVWGDGVAFFAPIHRLDRQLRPDVWDPQPF